MSNLSQHITNRTLKNLPRQTKPWFIRDTELIGFSIKVNPKSSPVYRVEARLSGSGRVVNYVIGPVERYKPSEARDEARKLLQKIRQGTNPQVEKKAAAAKGTTLKELLEAFLVARSLKPSTKTEYRYLIEKYCKKWLHRPILDLTSEDIESWYRAGSVTPTQTHKVFRTLRSILNFGKGRNIIRQNPCDIIGLTRSAYRPQQRHSFVELDLELPRFLEALVDFSRRKGIRESQKVALDYLILVLTTGLRAEEAAKLSWGDIDFGDKKQIVLSDPKNRQPHYVPMTFLVHSMLKKRKDAGSTNNVFPNVRRTGPITDVRKTLHAICHEAGIERKTLHDLRRTFASLLNEIGVGLADTRILMNHRDRSITLQYIRGRREKLRGHLNKLVEHLDLAIAHVTESGQVNRFSGTLRANLYDSGELVFAGTDLHPDYPHEREWND